MVQAESQPDNSLTNTLKISTDKGQQRLFLQAERLTLFRSASLVRQNAFI